MLGQDDFLEVPVQTPGQASDPQFILRFAMTVAPILAGVDKFLNLVIDWDKYLAPLIVALSPLDARSMILILGLVEIAAGILVAFRPRMFGYVLIVWVVGLTANFYLRSGHVETTGWPLGRLFRL